MSRDMANFAQNRKIAAKAQRSPFDMISSNIKSSIHLCLRQSGNKLNTPADRKEDGEFKVILRPLFLAGTDLFKDNKIFPKATPIRY